MPMHALLDAMDAFHEYLGRIVPGYPRYEPRSESEKRAWGELEAEIAAWWEAGPHEHLNY